MSRVARPHWPFAEFQEIDLDKRVANHNKLRELTQEWVVLAFERCQLNYEQTEDS